MATKDFLLAGGFVSPSEVDIPQQRSYATPGSHVSRIACQPFGCYGHHKFCTRSLPSSLLQFSRGCHADVNGDGLSKYTHWGWQKPSKSFFTALPEGFKFQWHRQLKRLKGYVNHEDGLALDWQWLPSSLTENAIDGQDECSSNVEIVEDNDDVEDQFLEERFDQFAMALAFNDDEMAEKALQEMGSPLEINQMKHLMKGITEIEKQLHQLYEEMNRMIEKGDQATANDMIEAKYKAVQGQFESGIQGMEQAAMLDMLAQLRMSLGQAEEVACLLSETKEVVDKLGSDSAQPLLDSVLEHMGSMYTSLGKPEEALPYYQRSLKIQEELHGQDSPLIVKVLLGLATTYSDMNDSSHAIEVYNRVLSILEKTRGSDDEALVMPLSRLGHSLLEEGRIDEAELSLVRALRLAEQLFGEYDGRVGVATCALARVKAAQGEVDESVSLYHKGLQIMEGCSKFADKEPTMEAVRSDLAELLNLLERTWLHHMLHPGNMINVNHCSSTA
ncbi:hypothetical protein BDL97_02G068500 [Sphagnum fallax]|nr:hypothetical protein BDL97_02G068500 [Sphagnum fallax]